MNLSTKKQRLNEVDEQIHFDEDLSPIDLTNDEDGDDYFMSRTTSCAQPSIN